VDDGLAWRWRKRQGVGSLEAIRQFSTVKLTDLRHIDFQREEPRGPIAR